MRYKMDRSGIGQMMKRAPFIDHAVRQGAQRTLAIAQSRARVLTGNNRASGRVENAGIQPVKRGESRITWRVVFYAPYAMDQEMKTGFLSGALKKRVR
jgi:hypothetical protein